MQTIRDVLHWLRTQFLTLMPNILIFGITLYAIVSSRERLNFIMFLLRTSWWTSLPRHFLMKSLKSSALNWVCWVVSDITLSWEMIILMSQFVLLSIAPRIEFERANFFLAMSHHRDPKFGANLTYIYHGFCCIEYDTGWLDNVTQMKLQVDRWLMSHWCPISLQTRKLPNFRIS